MEMSSSWPWNGQVIRAQAPAPLRLGSLCALTKPGCELEEEQVSVRGRCKGTHLYTLKLQQRSALLVWLHSRPFSVASVFNSTLWPHLSRMQLGLKGRKERGMAGGALREVAAWVRKREGRSLGGAGRATSSSSTARGQHGTCRKAEDHAGPTLPSEFPCF